MGEELIQLADAGLAGVMIALIILCLSTVYFLWKIACNHINHSTDAINKNTEVLASLSQFLKDKLK